VAIYINSFPVLVKTCSRLTAPKYGNITCKNTRDIDHYTNGDVCIFKCNEGFKLIGQATKVCNGNGEWSPITHTNCGKMIVNIFFMHNCN